jgi:hypothetical protein
MLRWTSEARHRSGFGTPRLLDRPPRAAAAVLAVGVVAVGCGTQDPPACSNGCSHVRGSVRVCRGASSRLCSPAPTIAVVSVRGQTHKVLTSERVASGGYYELALQTPGRDFITAVFDHRSQTRPLSVHRGRTKTIDFVLHRR